MLFRKGCIKWLTKSQTNVSLAVLVQINVQ